MIHELEELEREITNLEIRLQMAGDLYKNTEANRYGTAKATYLIAEAKAKMELYEEGKKDPAKKLTDSLREAAAILRCQDELMEKELSQADFIASKEVLRALQSELSGKQTRVGLWKAEWGLSGRGDVHNQRDNPHWERNTRQLEEPPDLQDRFSGMPEDDDGGPRF